MTVSSSPVKKIFKVVAWVFGIMLLLVLAVLLCIRIPAVQNYLVQKVTTYVSSKTHTRVTIGSIYIGFPSTVIIKEIFLDDLRQDTLLYAHEVRAGLGIYGLIKGNISLGDVHLEKVVANLFRNKTDSTFNFNFLIDAFAKKDGAQQPKDSVSKPLNLSVDEVTLSEVTFRFRDDVTGIRLNTYLGEVVVPINDISLDSLRFNAGDIGIHNSTVELALTKESSDDTTDSGNVLPEFSADELVVTGLTFHLSNTVDSSDMVVKSGELKINNPAFSLKTNAILAGAVSLDKASCMIFNQQRSATATNARAAGADVNISLPFSIDVEELEVTESIFALKNGSPVETKSFDPENMVLAVSRIKAEEIYHNKGTASLHIIQASVSDRSGLAVRNLEGLFKTDPQSASVTNLQLTTGNSEVKGDIQINYTDLQNFIEHPGTARISVLLENSVVSVKDLVRFDENLLKQEIFSNNRDRRFIIDLNATGNIDQIHVKTLVLKTGNSTSIRVSGNVNGLPDMDRLYMVLKAERITTTSDDIRSLVTIPETVNLPEQITLTGNFRGSVATFSYDVIAGTNRGYIIASGSFDALQSSQPGYDLTASVKGADLGFILKNDMFGSVNARAELQGSGFQPETMNTNFKLVSDTFTLNKYPYTHIEFEGTVANGVVATSGGIGDTNLDMQLEASVGFIRQKEFYKARIDLKGIDMEALNFSDHALRANGTGIIDLHGNQMNNLNGNIAIKDVLIVKKGKNYPIENLAVISINENNSKSLNIESSLLTAKFEGTISIDETARQLGQFVNKYFTTDSIPVMPDSISQSFEFSVKIKNAPVISEVFVPGLDSFIPGPIIGNYNSSESKLGIIVQLPQVVYKGIRVDSLNLRVDSDNDKLTLMTTLNRLSMGDIELERTEIFAAASGNKIDVGIAIASEEKVKLKLAAQVVKGRTPKSYKIAIDEKGIILNDEKWTIPDDNFVEIGGPFPLFHNFSLTHEQQSVYIDVPSGGSEGIGVVFKDFRIGILSEIIERDVSYLDGVLNGQLDIIREQEGQGIVANVKLDKFSFRGTPVGDFVLEAKSSGKARYLVNLKMTGYGNDLVASGSYEADSTGGKIDAEVDINKLAVKSIEPFTKGQITRSKGIVSGKFEIGGTLALPEVEGELGFTGAGFSVTYLNNYFNLKNEKIKIEQDQVVLKSFTITDTLNHTAVLNGKISMKDLTNPEFFVDLSTDKFLAMNTQSGDNKLFFGTLIISSKIKIRGDKNLPVITSNVKLLEGSSFTFVVPEDKTITDRGEEDVKFTDPYNRINPIMKRETELDTFKTEITGFDITSNVEITKETTLRILVDQESGDSLVIKGDATMSFAIDPSGKTSLTGGFEINEGSYRVSLQNLVKRNFEITKGSSINWRGDILDAEINIDAVNIVNAVPLELVADQVAGLSEQEINAYRQRLPFQVILHMRGELMKPEISFEISLAPEDQGVLNGTVYAKLTLLNQDPSELNKQVFALLVLNRFVQENPLNNDSGSGLRYVARNSVSKFLSQQLNIFAEQFIKGVELNFDVQSYEEYTTGTVEGRTEVNIGATKKFLNDRLIVQVAGNVDVEGERTSQNDVSNLVGDIVLEYLLTEDGRYRLRVFRKDQYAGVLDGEVKEAGIGLLYTRDFDRWDQLFSKPEPPTPLTP